MSQCCEGASPAIVIMICLAKTFTHVDSLLEWYLRVSGIGHQRQARGLAEQTGGHAEHEAREQVEEDGVVEDNGELVRHWVSGSQQPFEQGGQDHENVENHCLHGVESNISIKVLIADDAKVENEEADKACERQRIIRLNQWDKRIEDWAGKRVLHVQVAGVSRSVKEREEVGCCRDYSVRRRNCFTRSPISHIYNCTPLGGHLGNLRMQLNGAANKLAGGGFDCCNSRTRNSCLREPDAATGARDRASPG